MSKVDNLRTLSKGQSLIKHGSILPCGGQNISSNFYSCNLLFYSLPPTYPCFWIAQVMFFSHANVIKFISFTGNWGKGTPNFYVPLRKYIIGCDINPVLKMPHLSGPKNSTCIETVLFNSLQMIQPCVRRIVHIWVEGKTPFPSLWGKGISNFILQRI